MSDNRHTLMIPWSLQEILYLNAALEHSKDHLIQRELDAAAGKPEGSTKRVIVERLDALSAKLDDLDACLTLCEQASVAQAELAIKYGIST